MREREMWDRGKRQRVKFRERVVEDKRREMEIWVRGREIN